LNKIVYAIESLNFGIGILYNTYYEAITMYSESRINVFLICPFHEIFKGMNV